MEKSIRRKFSDEFKEEAVKRVTEQGYKIIEAAWNLGIHATQLRRWVKDKTTEANPSTASMGAKNVKRYVDTLLERRLSAQTINGHLIAIRRFYAYHH